MVKGISRQVIVVHSPDPKIFEQAIFILKDEAVKSGGISDEALLGEAKKLIHGTHRAARSVVPYAGPLWACGGAAVTGLVWLISSFL